jgi:NADH:quinone reductase (non-electrogenic)
MTHLRVLAAITAVTTIASLAEAQTQAQARSEAAALDSVDRYITKQMRSARIPGLALGIVRDDRIVYLKGYGDADSSGRAVTARTPFLIGSITKSFTALAVLQLVDAGKVDLDEPVQRYIPWFRTADSAASARITVRELLTMRSGLPQVYETQRSTAEDDRALERGVRSLRTRALRSAPGRAEAYSNAGYETLGMLIQSVSGQSYEAYLAQHVFAPLAMHDAFTSQDTAIRHGMAEGHRWWFGVPVASTLPYNRAELPAGYIIASAEDMTHFLIAELNAGQYGAASVLSPTAMSLRHSDPFPGGYGYGWDPMEYNGHLVFKHDGGTANFQSAAVVDPVAGVGVFVASNANNALDTFASPHGSSPLDGPTDRAIAATVLGIVSHQPLPYEGPGHELLTDLFNLVLGVLTVALVIALVRMPAFYRRLQRRGIADRAALLRTLARVSVMHFCLPVALLYQHFAVPAWRAIAVLQPDLAWWLTAVAIVLAVKGVVELILAWVIARRTTLGIYPVPATNAATPTGNSTRVVVVGGGVGGLAAARQLDKLLRDRPDVEITLVNRDNFFLLSPLLFEACSGVLELRHCAQPIRPCLRRVQFLEATVEEIDVVRRVVRAVAADGAPVSLPYDHVIVALGASTNQRLIRGSEHARTFKTVTDALLLRNHLIAQLERASVERDPAVRRKLLTVVVIGGGLVGVELLGELTAFMEDELRYYPQLARGDFAFHLFEAGPRLLPESKPFLASYAARILAARGAHLHVGTAVNEITPDRLRYQDRELVSPTIILAAGIVPNDVAAAMNVARDRRGRLLTQPTLRSASDERVWAFGDCASTPAPDGKPYPALAQHAVRAARVVARNVVAAIAEQPLRPFVYEPLGLMAAFGHRKAAVEFKSLHFTGFIAWWMRRTYYLFQMPRWDTRIRIAFDWTVSLFYRPDLTKIDVIPAPEADREEPADEESGRMPAGVS